VLPVFAWTFIWQTKHPPEIYFTQPLSQMQDEHYLYLYRLSTRLWKRNASILLETIVYAAEVTSALLLNRHLGHVQ
jgi:hypothetical protein